MKLPDQENFTSGSQSRLGVENVSELLKQFELDQIHRQFFDRLVILVIASLGLITALAWDDTLRDIFKIFFGTDNSLSDKIIYTIIITVIAVTISLVLGKLSFKKKKKR